MSSQTTSTNKSAPAHGRFLRRVLRGNAIFCSLSAALFLLAAQPLSEFTGLASMLFTFLGIAFIPFAGFVFFTASQRKLNRPFAILIFVLDLAWVLGSYGLLLVGWLPLTTAGKWAVGLTAEAVAIFAIFEFIGLWRWK